MSADTPANTQTQFRGERTTQEPLGKTIHVRDAAHMHKML